MNISLKQSPYRVVCITSQIVAGEWFGQKVLDIEDLHQKELEFEVLIHSLKLRELSESVSVLLRFSLFTILMFYR